MKNNGLISVIVPNFNNASYVEECLRSILRQTYQHIEVIVVDDGSTDNSVEIIKHYAVLDPRIHPVFNGRNVGVAQNRHDAIMMSNGEFITTLDSDDIFFREDKLEKELACLLARKSEDINCIVFSGIVLLDSGGDILGRQHATIREGMLLHDILTRTCMIPRDFLFTKEQYLKAGGFDMGIPIYEDWDLKIRLAAENKFFYSGIDGIGYRRHGKGLSAISPLQHIRWLNRIFVKNIALMQFQRVNTIFLFYKFLWRLFVNYLKNGIRNFINRVIDRITFRYDEIILSHIDSICLKVKIFFRRGIFSKNLEQDQNGQRSFSGKNKVIINVQYGLGNRLRALASALVLAQKTGREFVLVWIPDIHCQAEFHDLFNNDFPVINSLDQIEISGADKYNYMDTEAGSEKDKLIDHASERDIYIKSAFVLNHKFVKDSELTKVLQRLDPVQEIKDIIGQYKVTDRIGLHIRSGGGKESSKDPWDNAENWSAKGKENLFYWRERSAPEVFMQEIDRLLKVDQSLKFFLAADRDDIYRLFQERYPDKISCLKRDLYDRSVEQQKYALADILLLSQTKYILGSYWSSFSEIAQRIGGNPMKYSGKDF